jgi:hypothetical protein
MESSLEDECSVKSVMRGLDESSTPTSIDRAADVVRPRKSSRRSSRHSLKLESLLHDKRGFERPSDKALQTHVMATFHKTRALADTSCAQPATDGEGPGNSDEGWLSDNASGMSTRQSSSTEALLCACRDVLFKDLGD